MIFAIWWKCFWEGHALVADLSRPDVIVYRCTRCGRTYEQVG